MSAPLLVRLASISVPLTWRVSVVRDIEEEAGQQSALWLAAHVLRVGLRMRWAFGRDAVLVDLRDVIRGLIRAKGFTASAVFTLVLGIGANLAVFVIVDRSLFRPMPFRESDRLVMVSPYDFAREQHYNSFPKVLFLEGRKLPAVEDMAYGGFTSRHTIAREPVESQPLGLTQVSFNFLEVLGVRPVIGRGFSRDDAERQSGAAMITFETWRARFAGSPSVLGMLVKDGEVTRRVVGVLPKDFQAAQSAQRPARFDGLFVLPDTLTTAKAREAVTPSVVRLRSGASAVVLQQQFDALSVRLIADIGGERRVLVEPLRSAIFWSNYRYLWLLVAGASVVGLLACANLASLLLTRGRSRAQETAIRASLGASTARLMTAELIRSLAICGLACAISVVALYWTAEALRALVPGSFRPLVLGEIDGRVIAFAAVAAIFASLVAGVLPAWRATHTALIGVMQKEGGILAHLRRTRAGHVVIAFEAAMGVVLVFAAAVVLRSFVGLATADAGFTPGNLHVLGVGPTGERRGGDDVAELARYRGILQEIRRQPDVQSAGAVDSMPAAGAAAQTGLNTSSGSFGLWQMTDGFLETIGARIIAGHDITADDVVSGHPVAVVSESAARRLWPDGDPTGIVGRVIVADGQPTRRVVGVIADLRERPDQQAKPMIFAPVRPDGLWFLEFAVRTKRPGARPSVEGLRRALALPFGVTSVTIAPAGSSIRSALEQPRVQAMMFGAFAVIGLLVAALGLYALTSFDVALRRYELGIRSALGASASNVRRLVVVGALRPVAAGTVIGIVASYWLSKAVQTLAYQVDARDPWTLGLVALTLLATSALAAWLPARRASLLDPAAILRSE